MKKVYFACSIRGGREDSAIYRQLVEFINKYGQCLSELFGSEDSPHSDRQVLPDADIYKRDMGWLEAADGIIAEVSTPSLGVGYELAKAEERGKPILALYKSTPGKKLSAMVGGSPNLRLAKYQTPADTEKIIAEFIEQL